MTSTDIWYTDRTRYTTGLCQCPRLRYLRFHHDGTGIARRWTTIPLSTGIHVHSCLEKILKAEQVSPPVSIDEIRAIINDGCAAYASEVYEAELDGVDPSIKVFTIKEQTHLIASLVWAWVRMMLPMVREDFTIEKVEEEELFPLSHNMMLMSRPDLILRRKADGVLTNHDFKTASSISDSWVDQWKDSIQMAVGSLGVEVSTGEMVEAYYLHGLVKGGRGEFSKKGSTSTEKRQYSKLCYARFYPPQPPLVNHPTWDYKGYWYDKEPVWTQDFSKHPNWEEGMSNAEFWVKEMPEEELHEIVVRAGPYRRPDRMMDDLPQEVMAEEMRWRRRVEDVRVLGVDEERLNELFPRSYNCYPYNSRCEFYAGCREDDWSGGFEPRKPHHTTEDME